MKKLLIQQELAKLLLQMEDGDRLPPIRKLAERFRSSAGSVHAALSSLEEKGAVVIEGRGHMGSYVKARSFGRLWFEAEKEPFVTAFTLPTNRRFEGLATGLHKAFLEAGIEIFSIFIRGSHTRIQALRQNRCHVAVMSTYAASELLNENEEIIFELPPGSHVSGHRVFYNPDPINEPLRVAIDTSSADQERLTRLEFDGNSVEFVKTTFMQIEHLLREDHIDAAVWTIDDMEFRKITGIANRPLSDHVQNEIGNAITSASLVARKGDSAVEAVVENVLNKDSIMRIQKDVIDGKIVPEY